MPPSRLCRTALLCALALTLVAGAACQNGTDNNFQSLQKSADAARDAGHTEEAIGDYSRAVALRPDWVEGWWDLGAMQYQASHYTDAAASLQKLTVLAPNSAEAWTLFGLSQFGTKDYDAALASLEKARKLGGSQDPEIAHVAAYHLALLLIRSGDFDGATALIHSAFGSSIPAQAKAALGLAVLRAPLLPSEVDPAKDALMQAAGEAVAAADPQQELSALVQQYPRVPWLHYAYGLALASAGETRQAMDEQKLETAISPTSPLPWIEMSSLALRLKQPRQAVAAARKAVSLDADSAASHDALGKALTASGKTRGAAIETTKAARLPHIPHRNAEMIALYSAHAAAVPQDSAVWDAAMKDYSGGDYLEAVAALKEWVERKPDDGTAWAVMGLSEFALKDYGNARIHLQRGVDLGLKGGAGSVQLAEDHLALLLVREGKFDAATTLLKPIAGKPPLASHTQLILGLALLRMPVSSETLDPAHRDLAQSAGAIVELLLTSRYSDAFPAFQKLIVEYPDTPWLHYAYGGALESLSQYDDAKAQMKDETALSPHSALPWIKIASISVRQHLPADALKAAQAAVALAPDSAQAHYELGRAWLESGDAKKAIVELDKANALTPSAPEIHFALARAYTKDKQPDKAAAERATFMQLQALAAQAAPEAAQPSHSTAQSAPETTQPESPFAQDDSIMKKNPR